MSRKRTTAQPRLTAITFAIETRRRRCGIHRNTPISATTLIVHSQLTAVFE